MTGYLAITVYSLEYKLIRFKLHQWGRNIPPKLFCTRQNDLDLHIHSLKKFALLSSQTFLFSTQQSNHFSVCQPSRQDYIHPFKNNILHTGAKPPFYPEIPLILNVNFVKNESLEM